MALALLALAVVILLAGHFAIWAIAVAALAASSAYAWSIWRYPYRDCWLCKGRKQRTDIAWRGAFGRCWICKGTGKRIRWGVRLFMPETREAIRNDIKGRNY